MNNEPGSFYCVVNRDRPSLPSWLSFGSFGRSADKQVQKAFKSLVRSESGASSSASLHLHACPSGGSGGSAGSQPVASACGLPQTYTLSGAGLRVQQGLHDVSAGTGLFRRQPNVYATKSKFVVFYGALSNVDELSERLLGSPADFRPGSFDDPSQLAAVAEAAEQVLVSGGSFSSSGGARERVDSGALSAELVLRMYERHGDDSLLLLLSELQGRYAFLLYDGDRRQVFAARDPSGAERLFYRTGGVGGAASDDSDDSSLLLLASHPSHVPEDAGLAAAAAAPDSPSAAAAAAEDGAAGGWRELPPGHFLSGRPPRVQQFALTPEQLHLREYLESIDDELPAAGLLLDRAHGSSPRAGSLDIRGLPTNLADLAAQHHHGSHRSHINDYELFAVDY